MKITQALAYNPVYNHRIYRFYWEKYRHMKVKDLGYKDFCLEKGLAVTDAKRHLTVFDVEKSEVKEEKIIINRSIERPIARPISSLITLGLSSQLVGGIDQARLLTNSVVFDHLPEHIEETVQEDLTSEEEQECLNGFIEAYLMDAYQERLIDTRPREEVRKFFTKPYGIPILRRSHLLFQQYLALIKRQMSKDQLLNSLTIKDGSCQTSLKHNEKCLKLVYDAAFLDVDKTGLMPLLKEDEVRLLDNTSQPDIFPQSPYAFYNHSEPQILPQDQFCLKDAELTPTTIYLSNGEHRISQFNDIDTTAKSLLAVFGFASSFAKKKYGEDIEGELPAPVTLQLVHLSEFFSQACVFQLNTLDLTGSRKNVFWHQPLHRHFDVCEFRVAKPYVEGFNPNLYKVMKSLNLNKL